MQLDGAAWLPFPGLRPALAEALRTDPAAGVALCSEYLDYSLQFIPVVQAVNDVLAEDDGVQSHEWCRLLLQAGRDDLVRYGTVSLRNAMWNVFMQWLFVVPRRWRDRRFPVAPRLDTPERAVCAGYLSALEAAHSPRLQALALLDAAPRRFAVVSINLPHNFEVVSSLMAIRDFLACNSLGVIATFPDAMGWMYALPEPTLRPEVMYSLRQLLSVARDVESAQLATNRAVKSFALSRANDALRELRDYVAAECFDPEKTLLGMVIERWTEIVTEAGGEVGRAAAAINVIPNNYVVGPALRGQQRRLFVGREDVYNEVLRLWSNVGVKQPLVFYGQRRMGKTSILLHMEANLGAEYLPVFLDLQTLATVERVNTFLYNFADSTAGQLNKAAGSKRQGAGSGEAALVPKPLLADYADEPFVAFRKFIAAAEAAVPEGKWAALMIDEFEMAEDKLKQGVFPPT